MEYLPISKATEIYKISKTALTRFANKNIDNKNVRKENGMFLISVDLLESKYKKRVSSPTKESRTRVNTKPNTSEHTPNQNDKIIKILELELKEKNKQIETLHLRMFEQNSIIQNLQNRLSLPLQNEENKEVHAPVKKNNLIEYSLYFGVVVVLILFLIYMIFY